MTAAAYRFLLEATDEFDESVRLYRPVLELECRLSLSTGSCADAADQRINSIINRSLKRTDIVSQIGALFNRRTDRADSRRNVSLREGMGVFFFVSLAC